MWSRIIEMLLGLWMLASLLVFAYPESHPAWRIHTIACGLIIIALAAASFVHRLRWAHLVLLPVAVWMIGFGYFAADYPTPAALQSGMFVGWLLLMFALVPNHAGSPPPGWLEMEQQIPEETSANSVEQRS